MSALEEDDAYLFVAVCSALARHPNSLYQILLKLTPIASSEQLPFTTPTNLLRLLLTYTSAISTPIEDVAKVASLLTIQPESAKINLEILDLLADVEDLLNWITGEYNVSLDEPQGAIVQTARDIVVLAASKLKNLGFKKSENGQETLFLFVKAKTLELSLYYTDVLSFQPLFEVLRGSESFESWYNGVVVPYSYYWQNYGSLSDTTQEFLGLDSYWDQFDILIAPLSENETYSEKMTPQKYLTNVILPFAVYNQNNLQLLTTWMYNKHPPRKPLQEFQLWDECIRTILDFENYKGEKFPLDAYSEVIRNYIASVLYFGLYREDETSTVEQTTIYDEILDTTSAIIAILGHSSSTYPQMVSGIDIEQLPNYERFSDFVTDSNNPLAAIFNFPISDGLAVLHACISTCCELFPISQLTIKEFLKLKFSSKVDTGARQKAASQILAQLSESNLTKLLSSLDTFSATFAASEVEDQREINQLVIERLLNANLLDHVLQYYQSKQGDLKMSPVTLYELTLRKFWDLFENASGIDEKIGKLKLAHQCLQILDALSAEGGLSAEQTREIIRIKHLLNAMLKLKNFRLTLVRNHPVTPSQIVAALKAQVADTTYSPIALISTVLEQNPKSYFAFEKLYKIASDLAIYLEIEITEDYLPKVQSACIESALVDGNFDFAYKHSKNLFEYYLANNHGEKLNEFWLTFYQVGKFILPEWLNDYDEKVERDKISVLLKQREILSLTLKLAKPLTSTVDNSRLVLSQLRHIGREINAWYAEDGSRRGETVQRAAKLTHVQLQENINGLLSDAAQTAAQQKNQASQKISKMLVSGLGWAIGAQTEDLQ